MNKKKLFRGLFFTLSLSFLLFQPGIVRGATGIEEKSDSYRLFNDHIEISLDKKTGQVTGIRSLSPEITLPSLSGGVVISDARTNTPVSLATAGNWKKKKDRISFKSTDPSGALTVFHEITLLPDSLEWKVEVENKTDARREPAVTLGLSFPAPKQWTFWDGIYVHDNLLNDLERRETGFAFPMACVYAEGWGLSLGFSPRQLSEIVNGVKKDSETNRLFYYTAEFSIPAGAKGAATFVLYTFKPDYGFRCALQRYYDLYPEVFSPRADVDPRLERAGYCFGCGFGGWIFGQQEMVEVDNAQEWSRRFFSNWVWTYPNAPICTPLGNYYGHKDKWPEWYPPREQWLKNKAEMYARGKDEVAMCHYVWLPGAESGIMEKFYPDAIARDSQGKPVIGYTHKLGGNAFVS